MFTFAWRVRQREPIHLHRQHQSHQQCRPAQRRDEPRSGHQHGHRQGDLHHLPHHEPDGRGTRVQGRKTSGQPPRKNGRGNHHGQRAISGGPSNVLSPRQRPGCQRHHESHHELPRHHPPGGNRGVLFAQPARLFGGQPLERRLFLHHFRQRRDSFHWYPRPPSGLKHSKTR